MLVQSIVYYVCICLCISLYACGEDEIFNSEPSPFIQDLGMNVECSLSRDCLKGYECIQGQCLVNTAADQDKDGVPDAVDNCPSTSNEGQIDCDQNGLGDVCDPSGTCGIMVSNPVYTLNSVGAKLILPCTYVEVERTNVRAVSSINGLLQFHVPLQLLQPKIKIFAGIYDEPSDNGKCPPTAKKIYSIFEQKPIHTDRTDFDTPSRNNISFDYVVRGFATVKGRVLLADQSPHLAQHGGIRVFIEGDEKSKVLTDAYGRFEINQVLAKKNHTLVIHKAGYQTLLYTDLEVEANQIVHLQPDLPSAVCRDSFQLSCMDYQSEVCKQSCSESLDCDMGQWCIQATTPFTFWLTPDTDPSESNEQDIENEEPVDEANTQKHEILVRAKILTIKVPEGIRPIQPNPQLTITASFGRTMQQVALQYSQQDSDEQFSTYLWKGELPVGDMYQLVVEAQDRERILMARQEELTVLAHEDRPTTQELEFILVPYNTYTLDILDEDADEIPDDQDHDQDGDGCLDDWDVFPRNPFACSDENRDQIPDEWQNDLDQNQQNDEENFHVGQDGYYEGNWHTMVDENLVLHPQLSVSNGNVQRILSASTDETSGQIYAYPYASLVHPPYKPMRIEIQSGGEDVSVNYYFQRSFMRTPSNPMLPRHLVHVAPTSCDLSRLESNQCILQERLVSCEYEEIDNHRFQTCYTNITFSAEDQGSYFIWVYDDKQEMMTEQMMTYPLTTNCEVCLARQSEPQSLYGLIHRALLSSEACPSTYATNDESLTSIERIRALPPLALSALLFEVCTPIRDENTLLSDPQCIPSYLHAPTTHLPILIHSLHIHYSDDPITQEYFTETCGLLGIDPTDHAPSVQLTPLCLSALDEMKDEFIITLHMTLSDGFNHYKLTSASSLSEDEPETVGQIEIQLGDINALCP